MNVETIAGELEGMRALARSLVHGDPDADDLLQDAAVAALEHPPVDDRPLRPWLVRVILNRRRMDVRGAGRRKLREGAISALDAERDADGGPDRAIDRARAFEQLASALRALDEPFRDTVIRRYLDGQSCAAISRTLGVPAGTVRWRLQTGLGRLRVALDASRTDWRRALVPLAPLGAAVKTKTSVAAIMMLVLLLVSAGLIVGLRTTAKLPEPTAGPSPGGSAAVASAQPRVRTPETDLVPSDPLPGQGRPKIEAVEATGGVVTGRVINWSTGDGVAGAELTFGSDGHVTAIVSRADGSFELAPPGPGELSLMAISAAGFLPYAPEMLHSTIRFALAKDQAVRGITVFAFPAIDYHGKVVDAAGQPVAGARVRLLGTPMGEQVIDKLDTEWTTGRDGTFVFHAADDAVFEAVRGGQRGWARLDGGVAITKQLTIAIADAAAHDARITGRVADEAGRPVADVLVRAAPTWEHMNPSGGDKNPRAVAFATSAADGTFALEHLDRGPYDLEAHDAGYAPSEQAKVAGGTRDVTLVMARGARLSGSVVDDHGGAVGSFTLLVYRRNGAASDLVIAHSFVDPRGRFDIRVADGDYELIASASGWAPSTAARVSAKAASSPAELRLAVTTGATLRGQVVDDKGAGIPFARIMREAPNGGASAQPANAGTVTRKDGSFELTGIPAGPLSITIGAGDFHPKIESGMVASDGATLGPVTIALTPLAEGEQPTIELVGVGIKLGAEGDTLVVHEVIHGGGAEAAGIVDGDRIMAVDGISVVQLGIDGSITKIRGVLGTTVVLTLVRQGKPLPLTVQRTKIRA